MFTRIHLRDYQCWKGLDLDLGPFTVIVGPSGYGKSSIVRALKDLFTCPAGIGHARHGTSAFQLEIQEGDDLASWTKSRTANYYHLEWRGDTQRFVKVGRTVPSEVLEFLNLATVSIDGVEDRLYLHEQFDRPPLLFDSPQQSARTVSAVTGIDRLVVAQKNCDSDRRQHGVHRKAATDELAELHADDSIKQTLRAALKFHALGDEIADYHYLVKKYRQLQELQSAAVAPPPSYLVYPSTTRLESLQEELARLPDKVPCAPDYLPAPNQAPLEELVSRKRDLEAIKMAMESLGRKIKAEEEYVNRLHDEFHEIMGDTCPLCGCQL